MKVCSFSSLKRSLQIKIEMYFSEYLSQLTILSWDEEINSARSGDGPDLHNGGPQLQVSLVHLRTLTDINLEIVSDQSKQCGGE